MLYIYNVGIIVNNHLSTLSMLVSHYISMMNAELRLFFPQSINNRLFYESALYI